MLGRFEMERFEGIKVFSATMARDRSALGEKITEWMTSNKSKKIVDKDVLQSSDSEFHCITIVLYYTEG